MIEIVVTDPGPGLRLGAEHRRELQSQLKNARRSGANSLLIRVQGDAWAYDAEFEREGLTASQVSSEFHRIVVDLFALDIPTIVFAEGQVNGLGFGLALAADLRFATEDARLAVGAPETANALTAGTSWLLNERAGSALGNHLIWTGQSLTAAEAFQLRLVSNVSVDDAEARKIATGLAALPSGANSALKRSTTGRLRADLDAQLDYDSWLAVVAWKA